MQLSTQAALGARTAAKARQSSSNRACAIVAAPTHLPGILALQPPVRPKSSEVFECVEETQFYSACLRKLVFERIGDGANCVVEFGSGDGTALINAVKGAPDSSVEVTGFEISSEAAAVAQANIERAGVRSLQVRHGCAFKGVEEQSPDVLVSNPPYIPAPDDDILLPALFGGVDGGGLTRDLLSLDVPEAMLLIPSYSDPCKTMQHASDCGYAVTDFLTTEMPFGTYSREPKVFEWIMDMKADGRAFTRTNSYDLLGVLFKKRQAGALNDRAEEALQAFVNCC